MIAKNPSITARQSADLSNLCVSMTGQAPLAMLAVEGESDTVCYVNSAFCDLVDQRPDQLVAKPLAQILPQHSDSLALLERVRRTGKSETHVPRQTSDLQSGAWAFAMWPVGLDKCTVGIMIQVIQTSRFQEQTVAMNEALLLGSVRQHELTEAAQRLNAELAASRIEAESANRSKDLFLATLSHEVRTPLNAILGWATILRGGHCSDADVEEGMEVIERNCHAQAKLIEDLLDISRIVSGKMQLQISRCELIDVIKAALEVVRPAAEAKHIQFETDLDPSASGVLCDENRMQQVIWNLLANAVKFTPPAGVVRVTLSRENSKAKVQVSDPGQGISAEFLPHVFDRFQQAAGSTRRRHGGLGLGLSIVKSLVELHQGTVHAHSLGEGLGATFTVCLPVPAVHSDRPTSRLSGSFQTRHAPERMFVRLDGLRVLAVDDEVDARRVIARVLAEAGAIVTTVASVDEALLALKAANPEVLVSDIAMPDQDGYDLIRHIRGSGHSAKDLPAVALTAFAHSDDRLRVLLAGFQIHVPKPVDPYELAAVIATLTGRTG